jgi:broad specificity phosphatase PhoE
MGALLLVRHAPTDASQEGRNLGVSSDPPLSAAGALLAARLATVLAAEIATLPFGAIRLVTSPALRCRQTSDAISGQLSRPAHAVVAPDLVEIDYGQWDGLTAEQCEARDPELRAAWEADPYSTRAPGGESGADVAARAFPILVEIQGWLEGDPSRAAIVVAHNHVNRLWLTSLLGWPMADYRRRSTQDPAGYSLIELNGGVPQVRRLNATPMAE